jgi:MFS family permease
MWSIPAFVFLIAFVHRAAPGVIAKDLMQAFGATGAIVGLLSAAYFYAYAGLMVPAGLLIDALGVRRVVALGSAVMGAGSVLMALAGTSAALFTGRVLVGLGATVTFIGALKVAAVWFAPSRFGFLSAVTATVGVLGALLSTAPLAALTAWLGWRSAFLLIGILTLAGAAACWLAVRDHPPGAAEVPPPAPRLREVLAGMLAVLANPHTWPPFLAFFFLYAAMGNLLLWSIPFLRDVYALSTTQAALCSAAVSVALLFSAPLLGYCSDRVWRRRKLPYTALAAGLFCCWLAFSLSLGRAPLWAVCAIFFGMGIFGAVFVLTWPLGREVNPPHLAGIAVAVANLGGFLGAALTQGPVGAILDAGWTGVTLEGARVYPVGAYRLAFLVCSAFAFLGAALSLLLRETRGQNIYAELRARAGRPRAA